MQDPTDANLQASRREPWNKGKLIGAKPPLRSKHVWSIRTKLQIAGRARDLAMFNLAIDSKLRGCDAGLRRAEAIVTDASVHPFTPDSCELAFSRFGIMFFSDPACTAAAAGADLWRLVLKQRHDYVARKTDAALHQQ
jgi:hypothetical protein